MKVTIVYSKKLHTLFEGKTEEEAMARRREAELGYEAGLAVAPREARTGEASLGMGATVGEVRPLP